jgi:hypothetical protein
MEGIFGLSANRREGEGEGEEGFADFGRDGIEVGEGYYSLAVGDLIRAIGFLRFERGATKLKEILFRSQDRPIAPAAILRQTLAEFLHRLQNRFMK